MALVVAIVISIPRIGEGKQATAQRERSDAAAALRQSVAHDRELVRPRLAHGVTSVGAAERAIAADVRSREHRSPRRVDCRRLGAPPRPGTVRLGCTAVTAEAGSSNGNRAITIGFPYRALADLRSGRLVLCRQLGLAGEGAYRHAPRVLLPAACGG